MKRVNSALLLVISSVLLYGCSTPGNINDYISDRGKDFSETVRFAGGYGYGIHARGYTWLNIIPAGAGYSKTHEFGWDGGTGIGKWNWYRQTGTVPYLIMGWAERSVMSSEPIPFSNFQLMKGTDDIDYVAYSNAGTQGGSDFGGKTSASIPESRGDREMFWAGADATAGFVSIRFGFSPHEFGDAMLGIFCLDIMGDDLSNSEE